MATNATVQPIKTKKVELHETALPLTPTEPNIDLGSLTKAQLLGLAADFGIKDAKSTMRKAELIESIKAAKKGM